MAKRWKSPAEAIAYIQRQNDPSLCVVWDAGYCATRQPQGRAVVWQARPQARPRFQPPAQRQAEEPASPWLVDPDKVHPFDPAKELQQAREERAKKEAARAQHSA